MRVLLVHDYGTLNGGAEIMVDTLRQGLLERGIDALWFSSSARPLPLPVVSDVTCRGTVTPLRKVLKVANPWAVRALRRALDSFDPDVVHVKMFSNQLSGCILPLLRGRPAILHVVNYDLICPINTKTLPDGSRCDDPAGRACRRNGCLPWVGVARVWAEQRIRDLDVFDRIVTNSEWVAGRLRAEGVPVHGTVPNGVAVRPARPPLEGPPLVGFAGRLIWKKGLDVLLEAFALVGRRHADPELLILGDGPERDALQRAASRLGLDGRVRFGGHLEYRTMERLLDRAWVQVVPSRWEEPFGLTAAEGMMRGTAVIASDAGGLTEQVVDGVTGRLYPAEDPVALSRHLDELLAKRAECEALGAAGRRRALERFTLDLHVDRMVELYDEIGSMDSGGSSGSIRNRSAVTAS